MRIFIVISIISIMAVACRNKKAYTAYAETAKRDTHCTDSTWQGIDTMVGFDTIGLGGLGNGGGGDGAGSYRDDDMDEEPAMAALVLSCPVGV